METLGGVETVKGMGTGFAPDTGQVPDASRITPMPGPPGTRAGHDIDIAVAIDAGVPIHELAMAASRRAISPMGSRVNSLRKRPTSASSA